MPIEIRVPGSGWDKTDHLAGFATLTLLARAGWPRHGWRSLVGLMLFGALIEGLQALTPHRFAEWGDLIADALGVLIGHAVSIVARRFRPARRPDLR